MGQARRQARNSQGIIDIPACTHDAQLDAFDSAEPEGSDKWAEDSILVGIANIPQVYRQGSTGHGEPERAPKEPGKATTLSLVHLSPRDGQRGDLTVQPGAGPGDAVRGGLVAACKSGSDAKFEPLAK